MEQRATKRPVQRREGDKPGIVGYAAVYYREGDPGTEYVLFDDLVERIMPGCFDRALREEMDVRALFNHNPDYLLGRTRSGTCRLSLDATGLRYDIDVPETSMGRDVMTYCDRGDCDGSSFSFRAQEVVWREQGPMLIRELHDVDVGDVGPVTFPAYAGTSASMRSGRGRDTVTADDLRAEYESWKRGRTLKPAVSSLAAMRRRLQLKEAEA